MLEKTLESPLDCKETKPVNPKGNQSLTCIERTDAEPEALILSPHDTKSQLTGKDPDAGKDGRQEQKGTTEDEMVGWCHWSKNMSLSKLQKTVMDREAQNAAVRGVAKGQIRLCNWTKKYISPVIDKIEAYLQNNMQNCNHKIDTKHQEKYRLKTKTDLT